MNPLILLACAVGLLSLLSLAVILWLLRLRRTLARERQENRRLRAIMSLGSQAVSDEMAALKKLRHDLRHCLPIIESSDSDAAESLRLTLQDSAFGPIHWAIYALARHYRDRGAELGFSVDILLEIHSIPPQMIPDVSLVLSNLLENALEALQREGGGWVRARCLATEGYLSIVIGNRSTAPLRSFQGRYLSSKAWGRLGIGLSTVQGIARKYGGTAEFTADGVQFRASVFLPYPPAGQKDATLLS